MVGKPFVEIKKFLADIEPEAAAAIACKVTFDKVFSSKPKANQLQNVTDAIGKAIEDECTIRHYETNCPGLLHTEGELLAPINRYRTKGSGHQNIDETLRSCSIGNLGGRANRIKLVAGCLTASFGPAVGLTMN